MKAYRYDRTVTSRLKTITSMLAADISVKNDATVSVTSNIGVSV